MSSQASSAGQESDPSCKVQELERELAEGRQQQTATSEILRIISKTQADVQQVFGTIIASAVNLCGARQGAVYLYDGKLVHLGAHHNYPPEALKLLQQMYPRPPQPDQVSGRAILSGDVAEIEDMLSDPLFPRELTQAGGWRSHLAVPMLRDGTPIGAIVIARPETGPFSASHIDLLKTFADQAVIAIENTRLFEEVQARNRELSEALLQQTATSEILRVISRSQTDLQPVFDAIAGNALTLCDGLFSIVVRYDGETVHLVALANVDRQAGEAVRRRFPYRPSRESAGARAILDCEVVYIPDIREDPEYQRRNVAEAANYRSVVSVPILRDRQPIGAITVCGAQIGAFSPKQINLLQTFADQAVIAIENTRLFEAEQASKRELQGSLEYQTATSEVLGVISRSTFDLKPVLEAVVESATRLCGATRGHIFRFDGEYLRFAAAYGAWPEFMTYLETHQFSPGTGSVSARAALERRTIQVPDVLVEPGYELRDLVKQQGYRTVLAVPMLREGALLGVIAILRTNVEPFTEKQVALVETFANQTVIAVENARLLNELRESLQQQTATADVLKVISRSTFDLRTVLRTLVESAARLCEADKGAIARPKGSGYQNVGMYNYSATFNAFMEQHPVELGRGTVIGRAALEGRIIHIPDVLADPDYTWVEAQELGGYRTILGVPMMRGGTPIGVMTLTRPDVRPFTEKQIELAETFADQAVIAIENARLFEEVQARNRELTETAEILRVISSSPTDTQPVFDTIV
jgi:GAF domain-containing protein